MEQATELFIIFLVSFLGSIHCSVMCCPLQKNVNNKFKFQMGRLLGYFAAWVSVRFISSQLVSQFGQPLFRIVSLCLIGWIFLEGFSLVYGRRLPAFFKNSRLNQFFSKSTPMNLAQGIGLSLRGCGWMWSFVALAAIEPNLFLSGLKLITFFIATMIPFWISPLISKSWGLPNKGRGVALIFLGVFQIYIVFGDGMTLFHKIEEGLLGASHRKNNPSLCGKTTESK